MCETLTIAGMFFQSLLKICPKTVQNEGRYLLIQHHVDAVGPDVSGELPQELQDVLDGGDVGEPPQTDAVPHARRGHEGGLR